MSFTITPLAYVLIAFSVGSFPPPVRSVAAGFTIIVVRITIDIPPLALSDVGALYIQIVSMYKLSEEKVAKD